jgi:CHAD domain-containing protein
LGAERVEKALESLRKCDKLEAIHSVRKEIKKLRALLRLVRTEIGARAYAKETQALREAASHLAAPRDAHVKVKALEDLINRFKGELSTRPFKAMRKALRQDCRQEASRFRKQAAAKVVGRLLRKVSRGLAAL